MSVYRFIDHLDRDSILQSPFIDFADNPQVVKEGNPGLYEIADKRPLLDAGSGENPFLIKKKLSIGPVEINTLLSPPRSRYRFTLTLPKNAHLEFTYGIRRDRAFEEGEERKRTVLFSIIIDTGNKKEELFSQALSLEDERALVFNYRNIPLADFEGKKVTIDFITQGSDRALACWFNPLIFTPQDITKNVILISLDTLRPDHLGCYGYTRDTSPHIDKLAEDSALFLNTFATSPWTLPSHVSLLTSLNCINHRVYQNYQKMDSSVRTLADYLREEGHFNSAITGGGYVSALYGYSKGFDSFHVRGQVNAPNAAETAAQGALDFIERNGDRNFFLFLHSYQIHNPYSSPPPYNELFLAEDATLKEADLTFLRLNHEKRFMPISEALKKNLIALYDGEIRYTDDKLIKPIIDKLKSLRIYDNTMIVLTADHGEEFYEHGAWAHSHSVYNETIKIPLIIKFPNSRYAKSRVEKFARIIDVMPTILDELDVDFSPADMDGESLFGLLTNQNKSQEERVVLCELDSHIMQRPIPKKIAINFGRNKLIVNEDFSPEDLAFHLYPPPQKQKREIFNLERDPSERVNEYGSDPRLARLLVDFMQKRYKPSRKFTANKAETDEKLEEELRALGYIR